MSYPDNEFIADKLNEMADLLEAQQEDGYRIGAYRRAARTVRSLDTPLSRTLQDGGLAALTELPGIGRGIGSAIVEMITTGRWSQLDRLTGMVDTEQLFRTVPGIGPELAARIHNTLHIDTLEQLEQAAHDGRLDSVAGMGRRRVQAIRSALADRLGHRHLRPPSHVTQPGIAILLDVDAEYRSKAERGELRMITPKRFNPGGEAWLPVLHTSRGPWQFTALFSNTQRAHELGKTGDWVVLYCHVDAEPEAQCTIVTEHRGPLSGRRVVRGREGECIAYYTDRDRPEPVGGESRRRED